MFEKLRRIIGTFRPWVWAVSLGIALLLCLLAALITQMIRPNPQPVTVTAAVSVIPAPTLTPVPVLAEVVTVTPTPQSAVINGIGMGVFVQISGTGGDGLRLRSAPGTDSTPLFLGMDTEVFEVKDGPRMANDIVWWYLTAPYDETRAGWAAASYLSIVPTGQ